MLFHEIIFHEKAFPKRFFHKMQVNHDEEKSSKPQLLIMFVGRIVRQELLDISADYLTNNKGV